jgi:hypothetical protein
MKTLYIPIGILILSGCAGKEEYDFTEHFTVGDRWTMKMTMDETIDGSYMAGQGPQTNNTTMWWETEVTVVDDAGNHTSQTRYTRIAMNGWDSGDPNSVDTMGYAMMMGPMLAIKMTVKSDKRGRVLSVSGAEGTFGMGNPLVDDNKITGEMIEMNTKWRPERGVAIGDTWEGDHAVSYGYPMKIHTHYTLRDVKDGIAYIELESDISPNPDAGPTWFGGMKVAQSLSGKQTGTIEVDVETGWTMKTVFEQEFSGTYDMAMDTAAMRMMEQTMAGMTQSADATQEGSAMEDWTSMMPSEPVKDQPVSVQVRYSYEVMK